MHNWSWDENSFVLPASVRDPLGGTDHAAGEEVRLGPWDVRVLIEARSRFPRSDPS